MSRAMILGVPIDVVSMQDAQTQIIAMLSSDTTQHITTPNPEMLVEAQKNIAFKEVLGKAALAIPDGAGLVWALKRHGYADAVRVTGTDLVEELASTVSEPIFFLGAADGVAARAADVLRAKYPSVQILGTYAGSPDPSEEQAVIDRINASGAKILFVAFGAPKQELWIARVKDRLSSVKVAIGIGGAFDFIAGVQKRAPVWMRNMNLEWLWRLLHQPSRIGRIWNAVIVFPRLVRQSLSK